MNEGKQLQGTLKEGIETLRRHAYNRIKLNSKWIKKVGSPKQKGREYRVSCKRNGIIYMLWTAYGPYTPGTMSIQYEPAEVFKHFEAVETMRGSK